ncbi:MAG TPA: MATE family efflux transporter [Thermoplasmatales archaeon]|nr:MATE family efflux transporter [Thermoplasmatales archaeon]
MKKEELQNGIPGFPKTEGVKTLLGDPKRAIIKLSLPMIVAMSVQTLYNFVDAIWVSGLGADALSAVGFFFPFLFMLTAVATGLGVGGGSAVSRRIGAGDKKGADTVATHTIVLMILMAMIFTLPFFVFAEDMFSLMGAEQVTHLATSYARVLFGGAIIIFFSNAANALLRGEGDARRAMYAMMAGAVLNMVLDPIFIYTLGFGVAGAAWATLLSMSVSSVILCYWLFVKNDTYLSITLRRFHFEGKVIREILKVGLPASITQLSMSFSMLILNLIAVRAGGTDGVAIFSTGWRVVMFATLPLLGIATAVISVTGAAYGARDFKKLDTAYLYAIRIGFIIEICIGVVTYILAPQITSLFTQSGDAARIADELVIFMRTMCVYYAFTAFGMFSSGMFQGIGKGMNSLAATVFRSIVLTTPLAYLFSLHMGLEGVWWGIVTGNIIGSITVFLWGRMYVRHLLKTGADAAYIPEG